MIQDAIEEIKEELARTGTGTLRPASAAEIEAARSFGFPPVLIEFYRNSAPDRETSCIELDQRVWSVENAIAENRDYIPGAYLFPLGFVVFASNKFGDAYCLDTVHTSTTGESPITLFPHDVIGEGVSREDVEPYCLTVATNLEDFLWQFARKTLSQAPKYIQMHP